MMDSQGREPQKIPRMEMNTSCLEPEEVFESWVLSNRDFCHIVLPKRQQRHFCAVKRNWRLGSVILGQVIVSGYGFNRGPGSQWHANSEFLRVRMYTDCRATGVYDGVSQSFCPGDIHILDKGREYVGFYDQGEKLSVYIPYETVGYDPSKDPAQVYLPANDHVGRTLGSYLAALFSNLDNVSIFDAYVLEQGLLSLVESVIKAPADDAYTRDSFAAARFACMARYIDEHLAEPDLGITSLCKAFTASRATLYRDFAKIGGVAQYIQDRRLQRAYRDLSSRRPVGGAIGHVALKWGFRSKSHFSKVFKRHFGVNPSDLLGQLREPKADDMPPHATMTPSAGPETDWFQWYR